jgi:hypothetical protein
MGTARVTVTVGASGAAYVALGVGATPGVRHSVALDGLEKADTIAALGALVLDFDYFGRLVGIGVEGSADSVLPPALLEAAGPASLEDDARS